MAAKRILKYLKGTQNTGLLFRRTKLLSCTLVGHCDSDWAGDVDTRKSTTAYVFKVNDSPVSWTSKLQQTVALSTVEAEYMAASAATQEAVHLRNVLEALGEKQILPTVVFCDNQGAIQLTQNPVSHSRTKHIDVRAHFVRLMCESKIVKFNYVPTEHNVADMFTKPLAATKFALHRNQIMISKTHTHDDGSI
jgi:hypothetical protein